MTNTEIRLVTTTTRRPGGKRATCSPNALHYIPISPPSLGGRLPQGRDATDTHHQDSSRVVTQLTVNAGPQRERTRGDTAPCGQAKVSWHGSAAVRQRIPHRRWVIS